MISLIRRALRRIIDRRKRDVIYRKPFDDPRDVSGSYMRSIKQGRV